ncbi:hypothetical protein Bbelb_348360 [Branchiostoma belcheri]|nr:hypothetical protein Bbelb_348360 [Branchiostoma belcheri]
MSVGWPLQSAYHLHPRKYFCLQNVPGAASYSFRPNLIGIPRGTGAGREACGSPQVFIKQHDKYSTEPHGLSQVLVTDCILRKAATKNNKRFGDSYQGQYMIYGYTAWVHDPEVISHDHWDKHHYGAEDVAIQQGAPSSQISCQ